VHSKGGTGAYLGGGVMTYSEGIDIYFDVNRNNKRSHCILGSLKGVVFMFKKWL
jgi:uncharacterized Fe-S cluster protein YjdI